MHESNFDFETKVTGIALPMVFAIQRMTHVAFHSIKNEQFLDKFGIIDHFYYCFGLIGLITGPYFDLHNYLAIFDDKGETIKQKKNWKELIRVISLIFDFQSDQ